jgi:hypothetical protein
VQLFGIFIDLERDAREAQNIDALLSTMANGPRKLINCRQVVVMIADAAGRPRVRAVSNVPVPDRNAPFAQWLEAIVAKMPQRTVAHVVSRETLAAVTTEADWQEWSTPEGLWLPLTDQDGRFLGGLWLTRDSAWQQSEQVLLEHLTGCYSHAWVALSRRRRYLPGLPGKTRRGRLLLGAFVLSLGLALALPVRQTVLAPAEVVPAAPHVIAAAMDGVIKDVVVSPHQTVEAGTPLFTFDDTRLTANAELAQRELDLARTRLVQARQAAFLDPRAKATIEEQTRQVALSKTRLDYAQDMLSRVTATAPIDGVAIFSDAGEWVGRPVSTGEKVMVVAAADDVALRIDLPVDDAIPLPENALVRLFLTVDPVNPIDATVSRSSYEAAPQADGTVAFRVDATFSDAAHPRIGLRGTARIEGDTVPLALYLFRRPLTAVRQAVGF